jgi:hypothetical protein
MDELLYCEEMMWLQRSRISWLKEGDCNTTFFHKKAAARSKQNRIKRLMRDGGQTCSEKQAMERMTREFFQELYKKDPEVCPHDLLNLVQLKINKDTNEQLWGIH